MTKHYLDFQMNANPFGPPKWLNGYLASSVHDVISYPDYNNTAANKAIANFLNVENENVAIANGSLEAIFNIVRIIDCTNATVVVPTYWGYGAALNASGIKYHKLLLKEDSNFEFDLDEIQKVASLSGIIFICNPNNPTGTYLKRRDIFSLVKNNPHCHFFIDEAHLILKNIYQKETLARYIAKFNNLTIIYSTSKIFNIGGLRTGIVISNREIIQKFKKSQVPYSTTTLTQNILTKMLKDKKFLDYTTDNLDKVVKKFILDLNNIPWMKIVKTNTHFVLCKILANNLTAISLADRLLKDGFGIRECTSSYPELKGEWVRITSNTQRNNEKFIKRIKSYKII